jgi:hypothetical protein
MATVLWQVYPSGIGTFLGDWFNEKLAHWVKNKYKTCRRSINKGKAKLKEIYQDFPNLFVHWRYGYRPYNVFAKGKAYKNTQYVTTLA